MKKTFLLGCFFLTWLASGALFPAADGAMPVIGEAQAHKFMKKVSMTHYREALMENLKTLDVAVVPVRTGDSAPRMRRATPVHFNHNPARSADGCMSCHYLPFAKGITKTNGG